MSGADVLSQAEIDELLSALSTGKVSAEVIQTEQKQKKVKVYDFKRPDKFSKDQLRTIQMIHENFARLLNTYLSAQLRAMVHVDVVSVDQLTYEEFIRSLPNPSVISVFQMNPLKGNAILEMNPNIVFAIIDRLFGGPGLPPNKSRPLTDIEETIMRRVVEKALEYFQEAWKQVITLSPQLGVVETNPQFTQIVTPNDMVVIVTLQAKIGVAEGLLNICLPFIVLEPVMSKLSTTLWVASTGTKTSSPETVALLRRKLASIRIPVIVQLGTATITVRDLLGLEVNDVLKLDTKVDNELSVIIGRWEKYKCKPGLSGAKLAVQITRITERGENGDG